MQFQIKLKTPFKSQIISAEVSGKQKFIIKKILMQFQTQYKFKWFQPRYPASKHRTGVAELMAAINLHILEGQFD